MVATISDIKGLQFHETPFWAVHELLNFLHKLFEGNPFQEKVFEPTAGGSAIVTATNLWYSRQGLMRPFKWITNDIDPKHGHPYKLDMRQESEWSKVHCLNKEFDVITNPPYGVHLPLIMPHAVKYSHRFTALFLLLTGGLEGCNNRADFAYINPPSSILSLPRYCFRRGKNGKWQTYSQNCAWFIWHDESETKPAIKILNQKHIEGYYRNPEEGAEMYYEILN